MEQLVCARGDCSKNIHELVIKHVGLKGKFYLALNMCWTASRLCGAVCLCNRRLSQKYVYLSLSVW